MPQSDQPNSDTWHLPAEGRNWFETAGRLILTTIIACATALTFGFLREEPMPIRTLQGGIHAPGANCIIDIALETRLWSVRLDDYRWTVTRTETSVRSANFVAGTRPAGTLYASDLNWGPMEFEYADVPLFTGASASKRDWRATFTAGARKGLPAIGLVVIIGLAWAGRSSLWTRGRLGLGRARRGLCPRCGYRIEGLPYLRCPECGLRWIDESKRPTSTPA